MKIYLIERNFEKFKYLKPYFMDIENVELVNDEITKFLKSNKNIQCVVSPANSFGIMDGGYDLALRNYYGIQLQDRVQKYIIENFYGEQPVGTSFLTSTGKDNQFIIHTPTMRTPDKIKDIMIIYHCMRSTLIEAKKNNISSIVIPMFGGVTGGCRAQDIAKMMRLAYDQVEKGTEKIDWDYAYKIKF